MQPRATGPLLVSSLAEPDVGRGSREPAPAGQRASDKRGCNRADGHTASARLKNSSVRSGNCAAMHAEASPGTCIRRCPMSARMTGFEVSLGSRPLEPRKRP